MTLEECRQIMERDRLRAVFKNSPLSLFSLFKEKQSAPVFTVRDVRRGRFLEIKLPRLSAGRVYRFELNDPSGKKVWQCVFDREEIRPVRAVAYSEPAGRWSAKLTDVATGLSTNETFEVK